MGKPKAPRPVADNEARAVARTIRVSPQKLNLVAAMIRGKKVQAALHAARSRRCSHAAPSEPGSTRRRSSTIVS